MSRAVVLLSGGLDSSTALAWAIREKGYHCHSVAFDYGQRHRIELQAAARVAKAFGVTDHRIIRVDLAAIGGSALTADINVPKDQNETDDIPVTYVPARNLIFLSLAAGLAEVVEASHLVIGANIVDYSGYPDCRSEFLDAFSRAANLGTKAGTLTHDMQVDAPLIQFKKSEIIALGLRLGLDYALTHSCYDPDASGTPCGHCDACRFRLQGFSELGETDPLTYRKL